MDQKSRVWLITGQPAIGKSTVISKVIFGLRSRGYIVGGCVTREVREGRVRTGFTILDLMSGVSGELASTSAGVGPRMGRYRVSLSKLSSIGASSLMSAGERAEIIAIDEIGPMELMSPEFRRAAGSCLRSGKPIVAVIHGRMKDPLIEEFLGEPGAELHEVTLENREGLPEEITRRVVSTLHPLPQA